MRIVPARLPVSTRTSIKERWLMKSFRMSRPGHAKPSCVSEDFPNLTDPMTKNQFFNLALIAGLVGGALIIQRMSLT
jgi:hypothetical protein